MTKKRKVMQVYRLVLVLVGIFGVTLGSWGDPRNFLYYTTLSNVLCILYFIYALTKKGEPLNENIKGAVTLAITVTMLIFWLILAPHSFNAHTLKQWSSTLSVHLIVPLMVNFDWLLFDPKGRISKRAPLTWLFIPWTYFVFAQLVATTGVIYPDTKRHFPYFFIDHSLIGWPKVGMYVVFLSLFFMAFGYGYYALDKMLAKKAVR